TMPGVRERELIAERDEARAALQEARERLEAADAGGEPVRSEAEQRVGDETVRRLREHNEQLRTEIERIQEETEARIAAAIEGKRGDPWVAELEHRIGRDCEEQLAGRIKAIKEDADSSARREIEAARKTAELRFQQQLASREGAIRREREAATEAADAA